MRADEALEVLRGLPMWEAGWAGDIAWFAFGAQVQRPDYRGHLRTVGQFALHVSCSWRWHSSSGFLRADESSDRGALKELGVAAPCVVGAERAPDGALVLRFDNGDALAIDDREEMGAPMKDAEYWRLFEPGLQKPHLVVTSKGVEWHEA